MNTNHFRLNFLGRCGTYRIAECAPKCVNILVDVVDRTLIWQFKKGTFKKSSQSLENIPALFDMDLRIYLFESHGRCRFKAFDATIFDGIRTRIFKTVDGVPELLARADVTDFIYCDDEPVPSFRAKMPLYTEPLVELFENQRLQTQEIYLAIDATHGADLFPLLRHPITLRLPKLDEVVEGGMMLNSHLIPALNPCSSVFIRG